MEGKLFNALIEAGVPKGFIENINNLYIKTSLQPHEYQKLRDFSERFVYQVFRRINDQSQPLAAIIEAMGEKPEKKFTEVLSPQGNSYVSPNWWHDKPEEFPAEIIKHDGGVWGKYAAKTIYGNFALDKASLRWAPLPHWRHVYVRPYKTGYMMVEIVVPIYNNEDVASDNNQPPLKQFADAIAQTENPKEVFILNGVEFKKGDRVSGSWADWDGRTYRQDGIIIGNDITGLWVQTEPDGGITEIKRFFTLYHQNPTK